VAPHSSIVIRRTFPWTDSSHEPSTTYHLMDDADAEAILAFARHQPDSDLAFTRTDITDPAIVDEWIHNIDIGRTITVLAEVEERIVGYGSLHHNEVLWTAHMGEVRVMVDNQWRGRGIARQLVSELLHIATDMSLERVFCQIPADQKAVRNMFQHLGFRPEAKLDGWIADAEGTFHDLIIMVHSMDDFGA